MGTEEPNDESPSVNELGAGVRVSGDKQKQNPSRRPRQRNRLKKRKVFFSLVRYPARKKVILRMFAERECGILA